MRKSKIIFLLSSIVLMILGVMMIFFNTEIAGMIGVDKSASMFIHLLGAAYFGFAMLNWMAKGLLAGGIYGRPIVVANFTHFLISSISLIKLSFGDLSNGFLMGVTLLYTSMMVAFAYLLFNHPKEVAK